jgi:hypothetical protein
MTLDTHGKQVIAVGLANAISIVERSPAHWKGLACYLTCTRCWTS